MWANNIFYVRRKDKKINEYKVKGYSGRNIGKLIHRTHQCVSKYMKAPSNYGNNYKMCGRRSNY